MLDDTCYVLGFDRLDFAVYTHILLNLSVTRELLQAITFPDAKRTFTKDVLMRIDLRKVADWLGDVELTKRISAFNEAHGLDAKADNWEEYLEFISPVRTGQTEMFA